MSADRSPASQRYKDAAEAARNGPPHVRMPKKRGARWLVWSLLGFIATPFVVAAYFLAELLVRLVK